MEVGQGEKNSDTERGGKETRVVKTRTIGGSQMKAAGRGDTDEERRGKQRKGVRAVRGSGRKKERGEEAVQRSAGGRETGRERERDVETGSLHCH